MPCLPACSGANHLGVKVLYAARNDCLHTATLICEDIACWEPVTGWKHGPNGATNHPHTRDTPLATPPAPAGAVCARHALMSC